MTAGIEVRKSVPRHRHGPQSRRRRALEIFRRSSKRVFRATEQSVRSAVIKTWHRACASLARYRRTGGPVRTDSAAKAGHFPVRHASGGPACCGADQTTAPCGRAGRRAVVPPAAAAVYMSSPACHGKWRGSIHGEASMRDHHLALLAFTESPAPQVVCRSRKISECNHAFAHLFGYKREELVGESILKLYPSLADYHEIGQRCLKHLQSNCYYEDERFMQHRNREISGYVVNGLSCKEIAARLKISHRTVEVHRGRIMRKLEVKNTAELVSRIIMVDRKA